MKKATKEVGSNKSQIIRDFAAANPNMRPSEIVKTLNEQGHKVYPAIVAQALRGTTTKKKRKSAKRGRKPAASKATKTTAAEFDLNQIKAAAAFVKSQGSVGAAIESIKSFQKIADLFK
jgi:hypothetical protein